MSAKLKKKIKVTKSLFLNTLLFMYKTSYSLYVTIKRDGNPNCILIYILFFWQTNCILI